VPLQEKFRSIFNRGNESPAPARAQSSGPSSLPFLKSARKDINVPRQSRGLEQFFFNLQGQVGLSILDLAGASQQNIDFLTSLGHKLYSANVIHSMEECFGLDPAGQTNPGRIEYFLRSNFDYPASTFDAVLMWDSMQFMGPALLNATVDKLANIMREKAYLLAFFTVNDKVQEVPSYSFRIQDAKTLLVTERGMRPTGHVFNNRSLEKLFGKFENVKFFLTKDNLREVIVRR
jgi:hypothetical protein